MNLLLTLDENYLMPCKVMLKSFFASNPNERGVTVYLLHSAIPAGRLEELADFCSGFGAELKPVAVDAALFETAPTSKRYPKEMYYRLLSPLILPQEVERVLYLDPDMLIINPLRPLWELNLYGKTFAAASHTGLTEMANEINQVRLDTEHEYFNSGVMLIDLNAARKLVTAEDVFACVSEHEKELILPDQDIISGLYGDRIIPLDSYKNNMTERLFAFHIRIGDRMNIDYVRRNAVIIHYCGRNKPWKSGYVGKLNVFYDETVQRMRE